MTVVAVTSTRSSPGATSLAVGLGFVWHQLRHKVVLVEADPGGGVLGLRFNLSIERSLVTLVADLRRGFDPDRLETNTTRLQGVPCLLAPADPLHSARLLSRSASSLAAELPHLGHSLVIDLGRLDAESPSLPLARAADTVLLVSRPRVEDIQSLLFGVRLLRSQQCQVGLVLVGDRPHHPDEIADLAGVPVEAVLPDDRALAAALTGGRYRERSFRRSLLWRSISALGQELAARSVPLSLTAPTVTEPTVTEPPVTEPPAASRLRPAQVQHPTVPAYTPHTPDLARHLPPPPTGAPADMPTGFPAHWPPPTAEGVPRWVGHDGY